MTVLFDRIPNRAPQIGATASVAKASLALSSAYTYNSAGAAWTLRFIAPATTTLTDFHFFCTAIAGTPGNLTVELRDAASATKPGTTLIASMTVAPVAANNRWLRGTFSSPPNVTVGVPYFLVIADAAGGGVNFSTVQTSAALTSLALEFFRGYTTANGFVAQTAVPAPCGVLKFGDGRIMGNPYTDNVNYASNTRERGVYISGLTEALVINTVSLNAATSVSGLKIYAGATAPGGATLLSVSFPGQSIAGAMFPPFTLAKATPYHVVLTFSGASVVPSYYIIEDGAAFADVLACGLGGGTMYEVIDNGAGGWTYNTARWPLMSLGIRDLVAAAGGGISRARILGGG